MFKKLKDIFGKTTEVICNYPMVLLMAFMGAVSLMCFAHGNFNSNPSNFVFVKLALVSCLGISLMFGLKMFSQRVGKGILLEIAGVVFLIFFYFLLPEEEKYFTEIYAFLLIPAFILSHLLVSFIAFLGKDKELNFWQYNKNLFITLFLTAIFTGALTGGVELAILAVDKLFDFNFNDRYYIETFYLLAIFGSSFIFLLFTEKGLRYLEKDSNYPVILKFFTQYILIPLLILYAIILYLYSTKILINWELPRGWVSYLVLAYSVVGILALLLVHPLKQGFTTSWVRMFSKIFYFTLIPLLILLFTAIFTRILEYGYTEPRYFVLLLALWLTSVVIYFIFERKATIKFVPISLFAFGLFSLIIPYLNTFSVAKRSQKTELHHVLAQNNLLENGKINFSKKVSDTVADEVSNKFEFLAKRNEKEFLLALLQEKNQKNIAKNLNEMSIWGVRDNLRNLFVQVVKTKKIVEFNRLEIVSERKFQHIVGYEYVGRFSSFHDGKGIQINGDTFTMISKTGIQQLQFEITLNGKERWNISEFIIQTARRNTDKKGRFEVPELSVESDLGNYHVKIIFDNIIREEIKGENIYFNDGYILIRKK